MLGAWLKNNRIEVHSNLPKPLPENGEALVRVCLAGICSTDLQLLQGYYPFNGIPGHEFVGRVAQASSAPHLVGKRVVGRINMACGQCKACRSGLGNHCRQRRVLGLVGRNGAFAEYLNLPVENLLRVPENVPDEMAVFAEPLAAALRIQEQVRIFAQQHVLLIGAGRLGQLIARSLTNCGCGLKVLARYPRQRKLLEAEGIAWVEEGQLSPGKFDLVIEAAGCAQGFRQALQAVRPGGTIVLKSTFKEPGYLNLSAAVVNEVTLVGSRCGPMNEALRWMADGLVDPRPLIDATYPLNKACEAFDQAGQPGIMKILLSAV